MSQSPFPQLLKRANISTYDPLITRIYTSTPSSKSQHSDWGLKFNIPINPKKGPRYIKFNSLDAGPGINCDWKSGEREARFIKSWGNGTIKWQNEEEELPKYLIKSSTLKSFNNSRSNDQLTEEIEQENEGEGEQDQMWMKDIESMSEKDFSKYLEKIRDSRKSFLDEKLNNLSESIKNTLILPEDKTLIHLSTTGKIPSNSIVNLQSSLTTSEFKEGGSSSSISKLHSKPHRVGGLSYSSKPTSTNDFLNSNLDKKGRVLNKVSRYEDSHSKATSQSQSLQSRSNNLPWVISLGGLTGKTSNYNNRITDSNNLNQSIEQTDYTQSDKSAGVGKFKVTKASISSLPTVLSLSDSSNNNLNKLNGRFRQSTSKKPSSLDTFKFDIELKISTIESDEDTIDNEIELGSKEWVGNENKLNKLNNWQEEFNKFGGGPRNERKKGQVLESLQIREDRAQTMVRLRNLLSRNKKVPGENDSQ